MRNLERAIKTMQNMVNEASDEELEDDWRDALEALSLVKVLRGALDYYK